MNENALQRAIIGNNEVIIISQKYKACPKVFITIILEFLKTC